MGNIMNTLLSPFDEVERVVPEEDNTPQLRQEYKERISKKVQVKHPVRTWDDFTRPFEYVNKFGYSENQIDFLSELYLSITDDGFLVSDPVVYIQNDYRLLKQFNVLKYGE